jgi:hypothetical protein
MGYANTFSGTLGALSDKIRIQVTDQAGWSISLPVGLVGTVRVQATWDDGVTWSDDIGGVLPVGVATQATSASGAVPAGATAMQAIVTAYTSGSCYATLRATASSGPPRATASGTLGALNDAVTIPVDPTRWATVNSTSIWGGGANFFNAPEVSLDGGVNWIYAPYSVRTDVVSANPTAAQLLAGSGATVSYSTPLPGGATHYRQRINSYTAGSSSVTLTLGRPLVPGVPVSAIVYDSGAVTNIAADSGTLDVSGWSRVRLEFIASAAAGAATLYISEVEPGGSAGTPVTLATCPALAAAGAWTFDLGAASSAGTTIYAVGLNVGGSVPYVPSRILAHANALGAGVTGRILVRASR